jgi:hemolysin III
MVREVPLPVYSVAEEVAHSVSHGIGIVLAIVGLAVLVPRAALHGSPLDLTAAWVFGVTLILLYVASTLYHAIPVARAKRVLRVIDHSSIYLLIAGTYTPFTLGPLIGPWGWSLLAVVWTGAIGGILWKMVALGRAPIVSVLLYVGMGWSVLVAFRPLVERLPQGGLLLLVSGGLCYTLGLIFFAWKSLRYHHFIWHLFVLAGSVCHYFAVLHYVIPPPSSAAL